MLLPVREPNAVDLRRFAVTLPLALAVLGGAIAWRAGWVWGLPLWGMAVGLGAIGAVAPQSRRPVWRAFMVVTRPVGRLVSLVLVGVLALLGGSPAAPFIYTLF